MSRIRKDAEAGRKGARTRKALWAPFLRRKGGNFVKDSTREEKDGRGEITNRGRQKREAPGCENSADKARKWW